MKSEEAKRRAGQQSRCRGLCSFSANSVQCTLSFPVSITWHREPQLRCPFHHDRTCEQEETQGTFGQARVKTIQNL